MRLTISLLCALWIWAGTVSLQEKSARQTEGQAAFSCSKRGDENFLLNSLQHGGIAGIRDNGKNLTVTLTPQWFTLPSEQQQATHAALVCYAGLHQRTYHVLQTHQGWR